MGRRTENCLGQCWVKQITVLDSAESSGELSGSALSQAENWLGQCWVKQRTVWDSAESSGELSGTVLSQAENCLGQRWVKQRTVLDSAESSGELSRSALSQAKCSQEHCLEQRWDHRSAGQVGTDLWICGERTDKLKFSNRPRGVDLSVYHRQPPVIPANFQINHYTSNCCEMTWYWLETRPAVSGQAAWIFGVS